MNAVGLRFHRSFERDLLGLQLPPVADVLRLSGWRPDDVQSSCSRCGRAVGSGEETSTGCGHCRNRAIPWASLTRLGTYEGNLALWIRAIKYRAWCEMGFRLGESLADQFQASHTDLPKEAIVVPMPMPFARRLVRGIDHARVIAEGFARRIDRPILRALRRTDGPTQANRTMTERVRLGGRGIRLRRMKSRELCGKTVFLVDDVLTSGASVTRAVSQLQRANPVTTHVVVLATSSHQRQ